MREEEQERRDEARAQEQAREQERRASRWREVRAVLRRCGLERLFGEAEWLRHFMDQIP